eukprot:GHVH01004816.1.p1 GENE.GHVH01004816.1~~GHVH01004816.1.p1  ORF type:complete len:273 (+),score=28.32 GHVH01004816.1:49-819(+)
MDTQSVSAFPSCSLFVHDYYQQRRNYAAGLQSHAPKLPGTKFVRRRSTRRQTQQTYHDDVNNIYISQHDQSLHKPTNFHKPQIDRCDSSDLNMSIASGKIDCAIEENYYLKLGRSDEKLRPYAHELVSLQRELNGGDNEKKKQKSKNEVDQIRRLQFKKTPGKCDISSYSFDLVSSVESGHSRHEDAQTNCLYAPSSEVSPQKRFGFKFKTSSWVSPEQEAKIREIAPPGVESDDMELLRELPTLIRKKKHPLARR